MTVPSTIWLHCDYLHGHPRFRDRIENGRLAERDGVFHFEAMKAEGVHIEWIPCLEITGGVLRNERMRRRSGAPYSVWGIRMRRLLCHAGPGWLPGTSPMYPREWVSIDADVDGLSVSAVFEAERWAVQEWLLRRESSG